MNLKVFAELTRINHAFLVIIGILVGQIIVLKNFPDPYIFILSALCGFFISNASFAISDYWDVETDKKNKRFDRPLARGDASPNTVLVIAIISFVVGLASGYFINTIAFYIAIIFAIVGISYAYILKKIALIGNITIAASMAIPFVFGNYSVSSELYFPLVVLAFMAFLFGVGREIFKSIQDMKGDEKTGRRTLPILIGAKKSSYVGAFFIVLAVIISFVPFFCLTYFAEYYLDLYYIAPFLVADILALMSVYHGLKLQKFKKIRSWTLLTQLFGLVGFLLGAVF